MRSRLALLASTLLFLGPAVARAQVAPRIVIAFDTSGSMGTDFSGVPTFGDGVTTNCTAGAAGQLCGTNCTAGIDTDCNGEADDSRIYIAKNAVSDMVLAFGDVDWALARFTQNEGVDESCDTINAEECTLHVTSYGNPQCNTGNALPTAGCPYDWASIFPAACQPGSGGLPSLRTWATRSGGSPRVCINYGGVCNIGSRGGDILVGFSDLGAFTGTSSTYGILSWLNGTETNFVSSTTQGNYCDSATTGDCELRPSGPTPLAGLLTSVQNYITPIRTADPQASCRPYSVILITDGAESCDCDPRNPPDTCTPPRNAAATLLSNGIQTYVVGLAIDSGSTSQLNGIATAGGTNAGGGNAAYFANDPATLAAGLSDIVQRSLLVEVCNMADDDCDGLVDEGVTNACGGCGAVPAEVCNGADDDCDTRVDEGVSNACGGCGPVPTEICNRIDDNCNGVIDEGGVCGTCTPTAEILRQHRQRLRRHRRRDPDPRLRERRGRLPVRHPDLLGGQLGLVRGLDRAHHRDLQQHRRRLRRHRRRNQPSLR